MGEEAVGGAGAEGAVAAGCRHAFAVMHRHGSSGTPNQVGIVLTPSAPCAVSLELVRTAQAPTESGAVLLRISKVEGMLTCVAVRITFTPNVRARCREPLQKIR